MRIIKTTLVAGLISVLSIFSAQAEKVKIGDPGWTGATAIANLLAAVVTDKMGGEAELVPGNNAVRASVHDRIEQGIARLVAIDARSKHVSRTPLKAESPPGKLKFTM